MLGDYYIMYKCSGYFFKTPIVHVSFLQDYLANRHKLCLSTQREMDKSFEEIVENNPLVINQKDPLNGETCMIVALHSELFDNIKTMIRFGGSGCISSIHNQNLCSLIDEKLKIENNTETKDRLVNIKKSLLLVEGCQNGPTVDRVWAENPLHRAVRKNRYTWLAILTLMGGHWNTKNEDSKSVIYHLINKLENDGESFVKTNKLAIWWILQANDQFGQNILHHVAWTGKNRCLEILLKLKSNANKIKREDGKTPLHYSAQYGTVESAQILITYGAKVNAQDFNGTTPLHEAALNGHVGIIELLLKHNANVHLRDNKKMIAAEIATEKNNIECVELLSNVTEQHCGGC